MIAVLTGCFIEATAGKWRLDEQGIPSVSQPTGNGRDEYNRVSCFESSQWQMTLR